jgi:hypothetical protein
MYIMNVYDYVAYASVSVILSYMWFYSAIFNVMCYKMKL